MSSGFTSTNLPVKTTHMNSQNTWGPNKRGRVRGRNRPMSPAGLPWADSWRGKWRLGEALYPLNSWAGIPFQSELWNFPSRDRQKRGPGPGKGWGMERWGSPWEPAVPSPSSSRVAGSSTPPFTNLGQVYAWPHERKPVLIHRFSWRATQGSIFRSLYNMQCKYPRGDRENISSKNYVTTDAFFAKHLLRRVFCRT